ncbi:hypothetical protein GALL_466220 [mine drainage metagenome]|uniref:Uncharacterized protein n=1 Tax=mine drainage metagenome TaxID=410659 RepID=A0A1J5Q741_9ZZZZ
MPPRPLHWLMADMVGVDTVSTEAATFKAVTQVDFMDAVPTSLAGAIGADTAEATVVATAMVATADTTMDPVL